jgi:SAM-dependent methyltransferase
MADIHPAARHGYQSRAETYVSGRPDYPPEVAAWLTQTLGLGTGKAVLDLGAGSGKFTPNLIATGARVIAVEPVEAMRARLAAANPGVEALAGTAEAIPLPDTSVDAVICAQAFHWFANPAALAEIRRVLKPGDALGLIWNVRDESVPWVKALSAITDPYNREAAPRFNTGEWRALFPAPGFDAPAERWFDHAHVGSAEDVIVGRTLSVSFIAALPETEQEEVVARVRRLIAETPELTGHATVSFPYRTLAFSCRRVT